MRIDLLGSSFTIESDEESTYLNEVVAYFSGKVDEVTKSVGTRDPLKISILAGILAADDYMKSQRQSESPEVARIALSLISELEESLDPGEYTSRQGGE